MVTEWVREGCVGVTCWAEQFSTSNKVDLLFTKIEGVGGTVIMKDKGLGRAV